MASDPTWGGTFPGGNPDAANRPKQPSTAGVWIGTIILAVGVIAAAIWFFTTIARLTSRIDDLPRVTVPGQMTVPLTPGTYHLYVEYPDASIDPGPAGAMSPIAVTDARGEPLVVSASTDFSYNFGSHAGRSAGQFVVTDAGVYTISAQLDGTTPFETIDVALAKNGIIDPTQVVGGVLGSIALGAVSALVGLILIIVTLVRRSRWRRQHAGPRWGGGYMPPGYVPPGYTPGAYPPVGYGPPGSSGPGYGAPGYGPPAGYPGPGYGAPPPGGGSSPWTTAPGATPTAPWPAPTGPATPAPGSGAPPWAAPAPSPDQPAAPASGDTSPWAAPPPPPPSSVGSWAAPSPTASPTNEWDAPPPDAPEAAGWAAPSAEPAVSRGPFAPPAPGSAGIDAGGPAPVNTGGVAEGAGLDDERSTPGGAGLGSAGVGGAGLGGGGFGGAGLGGSGVGSAGLGSSGVGTGGSAGLADHPGAPASAGLDDDADADDTPRPTPPRRGLAPGELPPGWGPPPGSSDDDGDGGGHAGS
jgi:hypothetical protein